MVVVFDRRGLADCSRGVHTQDSISVSICEAHTVPSSSDPARSARGPGWAAGDMADALAGPRDRHWTAGRPTLSGLGIVTKKKHSREDGGQGPA